MSLMKINVNADEIQKIKSQRSQRALNRNRWYLYAMLSLNPSIIKYRVRFLETKREKKTSFFKSPFGFGVKNESFNEEIITKSSIPKDDMAIAFEDNYNTSKRDETSRETEKATNIQRSTTTSLPTSTTITTPTTSKTSKKPKVLLLKHLTHEDTIPYEHPESLQRTSAPTELIAVEYSRTNNESKIDLSEADGYAVDFRDNKVDILDTDEATPILMRKGKMGNTKF